MFKYLLGASALLVAVSSQANPSLSYPIGKPTLGCVKEAALRNNVPFELLLAVNSVERGRTGQYVGNQNGTKDTGAFQINSIHYSRARQLNVSPEDLASRGCYNAQFAGMLLREAINRPDKQNLDFFTRAAGYHSWTPKYNAIYRRKLESYTYQWKEWLNRNNIRSMPSQNEARSYSSISYNPNNPYSMLF